jgi:hypothetical protein
MRAIGPGASRWVLSVTLGTTDSESFKFPAAHDDASLRAI